jgi:hypothetical protein
MPGRSGQTLLFQVDESKLPPMAPPFLAADLDTSGSSATGPASTAAAGNVQDVMMLYTPAVRNSYGSTAITEAALLDAVVATNQAYVDSQADIQLNVVHMAEVNYTETGDMGVTLSRLRTNNDSYMDDVHGWRDTYGADLVAMISMDTNYCGIAYVMSIRTLGVQRDQKILRLQLHARSRDRPQPGYLPQPRRDQLHDTGLCLWLWSLRSEFPHHHVVLEPMRHLAYPAFFESERCGRWLPDRYRPRCRSCELGRRCAHDE